MAKPKEPNEYVLVYAIFAYHRFKAITVTGYRKEDVMDEFYQKHDRNDYRIKGVYKINSEDWERQDTPEEIAARYKARRTICIS